MTLRPEAAVRPARREDGDELYRLAAVLATSAVPVRQAFDVALGNILADPGQVLLVAGPAAGSAAGLVGYLHGLAHPAFHANGLVAWVEEIVVDAAWRGTGVGRALMTAFEDWSATPAVDARYLALATRRAAGFYRALGYEESATYFKKSR